MQPRYLLGNVDIWRDVGVPGEKILVFGGGIFSDVAVVQSWFRKRA